jgi:DNA-binding Xre family transcriptional regulator
MGRQTSKVRGKAIVRRLKQIGKSKTALAEYLDVAPARVTKLCKGEEPTLSEALGLCEFLLWTMGDMLEYSPELEAIRVVPLNDDIKSYLQMLSDEEKMAWHYWMMVDFRNRVNKITYPDIAARMAVLKAQASEILAQPPSPHKRSNMYSRRITDRFDELNTVFEQPEEPAPPVRLVKPRGK